MNWTVKLRPDRVSSGPQAVAVGPRPFVRSIDAISTRVFVAAILAGLLALLLVKNSNLVSPIMGGDEYAYFSQSREFPNVANLQNYDPTSAKSNNVVYFWIGHLLWSKAVDPALTMRVLQSFFYILIFPAFYVLCRQFLSRRSSAATVFIGMLTALSTYSSYFMPETVYVLLFFLLTAWAVFFSKRPAVSALGSGLFVALLTLTKPHGIAMALGVGLTWMVCILLPRLVGIARSRSALALSIFVASFYVSLVVVNALLTGRLQFDPALFVGEGYVNFWASRPRAMAPLRDLVTVVAGNAVPLALLIGFPFVYAALHLAHKSPMQDGSLVRERERLWFFAILTVCLSVISLGMTVNFTAQVGGEEIWRMHGRYYSFLIPLYLLLMFAAAESQSRTSGGPPWPWLLRAAAIMGLALLAIIQFSWRTGYTIAPWDFPEIFVLTAWNFFPDAWGWGTRLVLLGTVAFAAILIWPARGPYLFACFFLVFNVASLALTTRWQFAHVRAFSPYTETAAALRLLIPPESLDRGVVIGPDRGNISYFLFALRSRSRVVMLPHNNVVDSAVVGAATWAVVDGPYDLRLERARIVLRRGNVTFLVLRDLPTFVPTSGSTDSQPGGGSGG